VNELAQQMVQESALSSVLEWVQMSWLARQMVPMWGWLLAQVMVPQWEME
jgi:hypothetical protein